MYQGMPVNDHLHQYGGAIPTGTRYAGAGDPQRVQGAYSHQQSPLNMSMMSRQPMSVQTPNWQSIHQQSALPSPTPSIGNSQQPSYHSATSQPQSSSLFGDPGSASSMPRSYYSYQYQSQGQYPGQAPGEDPHAYSGLQIPPGATLGSTQSHGYPHGYLPSSSIYATEPGEVAGAYAYMDPPEAKF